MYFQDFFSTVISNVYTNALLLETILNQNGFICVFYKLNLQMLHCLAAWRNTLHYSYILRCCNFQTRVQFDRPKWVPVWICVIYNSKLEPSLDVQTNIQCGFECDQCLPTQNLLRLFILLLLLMLKLGLVEMLIFGFVVPLAMFFLVRI